jgi:hypothetical protein
MKITMLRNPGKAYGCELLEGQTGVVDKDLGERLIEHGVAVSADAVTLKGVPNSPDIGEAAVAPEIKKGRKTKADE